MQSEFLSNLLSLYNAHSEGKTDCSVRIRRELLDACRMVCADFDLDSSQLLQHYFEYFSDDPSLKTEIDSIAAEFCSMLEQLYAQDPSSYSILLSLGCLDLRHGNARRAMRRLEKVASSGFEASKLAKSIIATFNESSSNTDDFRHSNVNDQRQQAKTDRPLYAIVNDAPDVFQLMVIRSLMKYAEHSHFDLELVSPSPKSTQLISGGNTVPIRRQTPRSLFASFAGRPSSEIQSAVFLPSASFLTSKAADYGDAIVVDLRTCCEENYDVVSAALNIFSIQNARHDSQRAQSKLSLITSVFKAQEYIQGFFENISSLEDYETFCDHFLLFSTISNEESAALFNHFDQFSNSILVWHRNDPGLYECWNTAIRLSQMPYLSNANIDDLRHPAQAKTLVNALERNETASIAATALCPFETYHPDYRLISTKDAWYANESGRFGMTDLGRVTERGGKPALTPHCIPHCMPVWRRNLHEKYGYFDEKKFGTYADWAFWLRALRGGEAGILQSDPLSFYYVNQNSHNRRGDKLQSFHEAVEAEFLKDFIAAQENYSLSTSSLKTFHRKLDLHGRDQHFGSHRNSFNNLINSLEPLNIGPGGIKLIPFIERTFVWGTDEGEAASLNPRPLSEDWIGILHVPFDAPTWLNPKISPEEIFKTDMWRQSMSTCRGIIGLSKDIVADFRYHYPDTPSLSVLHPTELNAEQFDYDRYKVDKRVIQAGDWMRKLHTIFQIQSHSHKKVMLLKNDTRSYLRSEAVQFGHHIDTSVDIREFVDSDEYDELLSTSVMVCLLFGTAANNLVIECMARATPLIINPLPGVIEYLGEGYPLYAESLADVQRFLEDDKIILDAHMYLRERTPNTKISYDDFLHEIGHSEFYRQL